MNDVDEISDMDITLGLIEYQYLEMQLSEIVEMLSCFSDPCAIEITDIANKWLKENGCK